VFRMFQYHYVKNSGSAGRDKDLSGSCVFLSVYAFVIICTNKNFKIIDEIMNCLLQYTL